MVTYVFVCCRYLAPTLELLSEQYQHQKYKGKFYNLISIIMPFR